MGEQDERREKCRSRLVCREIKRAKDRDEQLGPEDVFSPMPPSEGLKMPVSTKMTGRDAENLADDPFEMATWDVSSAQFYGEARRWIYTHLPEGDEQKSWPDSAVACMERVTQRQLWKYMVRSVEREFHGGRSRVPCFLL